MFRNPTVNGKLAELLAEPRLAEFALTRSGNSRPPLAAPATVPTTWHHALGAVTARRYL